MEEGRRKAGVAAVSGGGPGGADAQSAAPRGKGIRQRKGGGGANGGETRRRVAERGGRQGKRMSVVAKAGEGIGRQKEMVGKAGVGGWWLGLGVGVEGELRRKMTRGTEDLEKVEVAWQGWWAAVWCRGWIDGGERRPRLTTAG